MEYTVIGDNVNLASRLESTAKFYGVTILVSENTYKPTKQMFLYRELDYIRVVGKTQPIRIYELIQSLDEPVEDAVKDRVERFQKALGLYRSKDFEGARALFEQLLSEQPDDISQQVYIERCENFTTTPPPADWDGVYVRTSK